MIWTKRIFNEVFNRNKLQFVVAVADQANRNNRVYPRHVLEKIVEDFKKKNLFDGSSGVWGQIGMPELGTKIQMSLISHRVSNLKMVNNNLIAEVELLQTYYGVKLKKMIDFKNVAFRLCGKGEIQTVEPATGEPRYHEITRYELESIIALPLNDAA